MGTPGESRAAHGCDRQPKALRRTAPDCLSRNFPIKSCFQATEQECRGVRCKTSIECVSKFRGLPLSILSSRPTGRHGRELVRIPKL